jgi:hypothetical protein
MQKATAASTRQNCRIQDLIRTEGDPPPLTTTACDTLHFLTEPAGVAQVSKSIFAFPWHPEGFKTVILLTAFPALGYGTLGKRGRETTRHG